MPKVPTLKVNARHALIGQGPGLLEILTRGHNRQHATGRTCLANLNTTDGMSFAAPSLRLRYFATDNIAARVQFGFVRICSNQRICAVHVPYNQPQ